MKLSPNLIVIILSIALLLTGILTSGVSLLTGSTLQPWQLYGSLAIMIIGSVAGFLVFLPESNKQILELESVKNEKEKLISSEGKLKKELEELNSRWQKLEELNNQLQAAQQNIDRSLSLLSATFEATADGIAAADGDGKIVNFNTRFIQMWDIPEKLMKAKDDNQLLTHIMKQVKDPSSFVSKVLYLYNKPSEESYDKIELKDGRTIERYSYPQKNGDQIIGRVWSYRDISEQVKANEQFRKIAEAIPIPLFINSVEEGTIVYLNSYMADFFGMTADQLIGKRPPEIFAIHEEYKDLLKELTEKKEINHREYKVVKKDGTLGWMIFNMKIIEYFGQEVVLGGLVDISEQKAAEQNLKEATNRTQAAMDNLKNAQDQLVFSEKMAVLGQLVAGIAHEVNTPIGAIQAASTNIGNSVFNIFQESPKIFQKMSEEQLTAFFSVVDRSVSFTETLSSREERQFRKEVTTKLEEHEIFDTTLAAKLVKIGIFDNLDSLIPLFVAENREEIFELASAIGKIRLNLDNISIALGKTQKIIFALKNYSRKQQNDKPVPTNIIDNVNIVLTLYHNQIKYGIELTRDFDDNLPSINCFPDELSQIWTNFLSNAIHAMNGKGSIDVGIHKVEENLVVSFTDSGKGIPMEIQQKIFQPFFTTKPEGQGTGLGLDICVRIIEKHGGKITLESVPGKTTFTVILPIQNNLVAETEAIVSNN